MTTHRFTGPSVQAVRTAPCRVCGRRMKKRQTFSETISPFNKRDDGRPKTSAEVWESVTAKANAWTPDPKIFIHEVCEEFDDA